MYRWKPRKNSGRCCGFHRDQANANSIYESACISRGLCRTPRFVCTAARVTASFSPASNKHEKDPMLRISTARVVSEQLDQRKEVII
jgi:hypothetical protein